MTKKHIIGLCLTVILLAASGAFAQITPKVSEYKIDAEYVDILMQSDESLYIETREDVQENSDLRKINLKKGISEVLLKAKGMNYRLTDNGIFYVVPVVIGKNNRVTCFQVVYMDLHKGKEYILAGDAEGSIEVSPSGDWVGYPYKGGYRLLNRGKAETFTFSGLGFDISWASNNPRVARLYDPSHLEIVDTLQHVLLTYMAPEGYVIKSFTWSPNGQQLALLLESQTETSKLVVVNLNGSAKTVYQWEGPMDYPDWSPDGGKLAIFVGKEYVFDAVIIDLEGNIIRKMTTHTIDPGFFSWAPNGNDFAYLRDIDGTMVQLWLGSTDNVKDITPLPDRIEEKGSAWFWAQDSSKFFMMINGVLHEITR